PNKAVVRLRVQGSNDTQYDWEASCLVLFSFDGKPPEGDFIQRLSGTGATMAMPSVRVLVANVTMRVRIGPVWLPPMHWSEMVAKSTAPTALPAKPRRRAKKEQGD